MGDNKLFGWESIFQKSAFIDLVKDFAVPILCGIGGGYLCRYTSAKTLTVLSSLFANSITIVPSLISLQLAAYAIMSALFFTETAKLMREKEKGRDLLVRLNRSCVLSMIISLVFLIYAFIGNYIIQLKISYLYAETFNLVCIGVTIFFMIEVIWQLVCVIMDIYNFANLTVKIRKTTEKSESNQ